MSEPHTHHDRSPDSVPDEVPLDPASESLADALRASFRILKAIMFLLVVVFLCSGVKIVDNSEEAVILRFGRLKLQDGRPYGPGPLIALPYPVDEPLKVPTKKSNTLPIRSHWFQMRKRDEGKSLGQLAMTCGDKLNPVRDGALLTADSGLVHVKWTLIYRIVDLEQYVRNVADSVVGDVEDLVTAALENSAIHVAATYTAEEITRTKTAAMGDEVLRELNDKLETLGTGIKVETLEPEASVPLQTLSAFADVTKAENNKAAEIRDAQKLAAEMLNSCAGEGYQAFVTLLDEWEAAKKTDDADRIQQLRARIDEALETTVSGMAGSRVSEAKSFYTQAVQKIEGDVEAYQSVMEEWRTRPALLINRLWEKAKQRILSRPGVTKLIVPTHTGELRILVHPDPKQKEIDELEALKAELQDKGGGTPELKLMPLEEGL